jgi:hypothetical protein
MTTKKGEGFEGDPLTAPFIPEPGEGLMVAEDDAGPPTGEPFDALAEFVAMVASGGNAFVVGSQANGTRVLNLGPLMARPLSKEEVTNLVSWLIVISGASLEGVCHHVAVIMKEGTGNPVVT